MDELIKRTKAHRAMGMSSTTAWRRARDDPDFPKAIQTGPQSFCYRASDIQRWIDTKPVRENSKVGA